MESEFYFIASFCRFSISFDFIFGVRCVILSLPQGIQCLHKGVHDMARRYELILLDADDMIFDFQTGNRNAVGRLDVYKRQAMSRC